MSFRGLRAAAVATLVVAALVVGFVAGGMQGFGSLMKSFRPFETETTDRTGPSVLQSLTDISEFHPAFAHYETVVDLEDDTSRLPSWVSGERVIYVGKGDVDAVVDFSELDDDSVVVSADGTSVTVSLPAPRVDDPVLDLENSYVADRNAGFITRFKGSDLERRAQLTAVEQMKAAVEKEGLLAERAEVNTTTMLRGLLGSLGFTSVTVTFDE